MFLARRDLHYDPEQWLRLPWHWRRMFTELILEQYAEGDSADGPAADPDVLDLASADVDPRRLGFD